MCISNNFIEQQAYEITEAIRKSSTYNVLRAEISGGNSLEFQKQNDHWNGKDFITKVILEDKNGFLYAVKPDYNGLRFAKGEISYKEYNQLQKKEDIKGFSYFFGIIGSFMGMMIMLMKLFT
ncbi:hypothetical protein [Niallia oryzisoli]|uniref:hypothetical protein n=1 Tax=Niallia oryzisoli TaxID=1737571 RepID=UPI003736F629